jgi:hypothetical protein
VVAKKWGRPEDELFDWASQGNFCVYYFKHLPTGSGWQVIGKELGCFLRGDNSVSCSDFPVPLHIPVRPMNPMVPFIDNNQLAADFNLNNPTDSITVDNHWYIYPRPLVEMIYFPPMPSVTVNKSDLFLHRDEIADMEAWYPKLTGEIVKTETNTKLEELNSLKQPDARQGTSNISSAFVRSNSHAEVELASPSSSDLETVAIDDSQPPHPREIDKERNLISQVQKPKKIKQPNKKKEKSNSGTIDGDVEVVEPIMQSKDDKEPLPLKTFADLQTRSLSLYEIIGDRKKGTPAIIPVGRSTWLAGVKSGRYPKPVDVSPNRVAWRGSDIYALLQELGLI